MIISKKPTVHTQQLGFALPLTILIAIVLIIAGGAGYYFYLSRDEVLRDKTLQEAEEKPSGVKPEAEKRKDIFACEKETDQKDKDYCYLNLAISIQDVSLCEKIVDVDPKHNCYVKVAIASNDTSICEIEEYQVFKDFCYQSIAIFNRDASVCEKIADPTYCYSRVAAITNDTSLCGKLPDQKNRDDCYYKVALFTENLSPCEEIINKTSKDTCYQKVGMARGDISFCEKEEDQPVKDTCYYKMAVRTRNVSLCGKIIYEVTKNSCYDSLGIKDHKGHTWITEGQRDGRRVFDLTNIRMAIELYYEDFLSFPVFTDTSQDGEFLKVLVDEGFMTKVVPLDPQHPERYYEYSGTRESYMLKCYIEEEGGINDMKDGIKDHTFTITFTFPK